MQMIQEALSDEKLDKFREMFGEPKAEEGSPERNRHERRAAEAQQRKLEEREAVLRVLTGGARE